MLEQSTGARSCPWCFLRCWSKMRLLSPLSTAPEMRCLYHMKFFLNWIASFSWIRMLPEHCLWAKFYVNKINDRKSASVLSRNPISYSTAIAIKLLEYATLKWDVLSWIYIPKLQWCSLLQWKQVLWKLLPLHWISSAWYTVLSQAPHLAPPPQFGILKREGHSKKIFF